MKKNDECKLIQDLLPNYIEKLTSEETNTYIENHIKDCKDCTKILKDMGEEVTLDKIDEMKKVDYLKKIKFRNRTIIVILLAILLILSAIFSCLIVGLFLIIFIIANCSKVQSLYSNSFKLLFFLLRLIFLVCL